MNAQYDSIAERYKKIKKRYLYRVVDYSLNQVLGNIQGLDVLDLACGDGYFTRQLKTVYNANNVVGADVSKGMIELAECEEKANPLGIKYYCSPAQDFKYNKKFDIVTGLFLLHYASSKDELFAMCKSISSNLKEGGLFIAANNKGLIKNLTNDYSNCDFKYIVDKDIKEGQEFKLAIDFENEITEISMYHYSKDTYNKFLKDVGFTKIEWIDFMAPPEVFSNKELEKWISFGNLHAECLIKCRKE